MHFVATRDIGKVSAAILRDPSAHAGQTYEVVTVTASGHEVAAALSAVSGVHCRWFLAVPKFIQPLMMSEINHMARWFESGLPAINTAPFHALVPDAWGPLEYFKNRGKWANGELFAPLPGFQAPPVPPPRRWNTAGILSVLAVAAVAIAVVVPYVRARKA